MNGDPGADTPSANAVGLTLRIGPNGARLSRDDGPTVHLAPERARRLAAELDAVEPNSSSTRITLTAAAEASLAEARQAHSRASTALAATLTRDPLRLLSQDTRQAPAPHDVVPVTDIGPTRPFAEVLAARRSARSFGPLELESLGTVLARSALVRRRWVGEDGFAESSRPAPSAGARHPLTLVVLAARVNGLAAGMWVLDPDAAVLRPARPGLGAPAEAFEAITAALRIADPPPATVFTVAQPARTLSRYATGMPLIWRDTGALLATLHLAATDLGLPSCIAGTSGVLFAGDAHSEAPVDTGAVAIGGPAQHAAAARPLPG